jgi:hypothetical protein
MTTGLRLDFANLGLDDYDRVCEALNFPSDWPDGLLAHTAVEVDGRLRVMDVWESRERFDRFVQERLPAAMREAVGDRAEPPEVTHTELHAFYSR